jgi:hypothetical protein
MTDHEFVFLTRFLLDCHNLDDLREPLKASFHFEELFQEYNFDDFIEYYNQEDCEIEQEMDEEFEAMMLEKDKAMPPSENKVRLQKSVEHSLNKLTNYFEHHKKNIEKYLTK